MLRGCGVGRPRFRLLPRGLVGPQGAGLGGAGLSYWSPLLGRSFASSPDPEPKDMAGVEDLHFVSRDAVIGRILQAWGAAFKPPHKHTLPVAGQLFGVGKTYLGEHLQERVAELTPHELGVSEELHKAVIDAVKVPRVELACTLPSLPRLLLR